MNLKVMVKRILVNIILVACISCFAQQGLNVYDAEGHLLTKMGSLSELNSKKCPSKRCFVAKNTGKKTNASAFIKKDYVKSKGKKRWYEVEWNQGVRLCPEKNFNSGDGIWIVNGSAHVDSVNCVYVDGSPYTRSILVLFSRNLDDLTEADSSWILVNQTIVELAGKKFTIYAGLGYLDDKGGVRDTSYTVQLKYDLIVDKTELRVRDALWLREGEKINEKWSVLFLKDDYYPSSDSLKVLDYPVQFFDYYLEFRSKRDGLEDVLNCRPYRQGMRNCSYSASANGYRVPFDYEWAVLQTAGSSKIFTWGNDFVEDSLKRYANIHNEDNGRGRGLYPVKQYAPNRYGLYDVYGNAEEQYLVDYDRDGIPSVSEYSGYPVISAPCISSHYENLGKACRDMTKYKVFGFGRQIYSGDFLLAGFQGMRFVRKLE